MVLRSGEEGLLSEEGLLLLLSGEEGLLNEEEEGDSATATTLSPLTRKEDGTTVAVLFASSTTLLKELPLTNTSAVPSPRRITFMKEYCSTSSTVNGARKKAVEASKEPQLPSLPVFQSLALKSMACQFLPGSPTEKGSGEAKARVWARGTTRST